jgi:tryptophan synthase beta chain
MGYHAPDDRGYYGAYGGRFVPETLVSSLDELEKIFQSAQRDPAFKRDYLSLLRSFAGRPTALTYADRLTGHYKRARIFLKREDLCHTGAHKINNTIGQVLLAQRAGKRRIVAETGAGQHGVATATVAAKLGLECLVYMGEKDCRRQRLNVQRMKMLGAEVIPVTSGAATLKDATSEAIRYWVANVASTFYVLGSAVGPHPYPLIVRTFQSVIGTEARRQLHRLVGRKPSYLVACVGGGSNSIGLFFPFLNDRVTMIGVEGGGRGIRTDAHAATLSKGKPGILHGALSYVLQDDRGQVREAHSISAGLDYPGVGPEHSYWKDLRKAAYVSVTDKQAVDAAYRLTRLEGIIPALESAHALAYLETLMPHTKTSDIVLVCLSGRGDKDMESFAEAAGTRRGKP